MTPEEITEFLRHTDKNNLDEEWEKCTEVQSYVSDLYCKAKLEHDELENTLEFESAKIGTEVKLSPKEHGYKSVTDKTIEYIIAVQPEIAEMAKRLVYLSNEKEVWKRKLEECITKKKTLEELGVLWKAAYFSTPKQPK